MANRLAGEASAYLKQHADNPVDWYPWGEEALSAARQSDRPILLSIGYSACHWCHVMAHESFENPEIARVMNEGFVCIKVDREERPDVDHLYQGVVQLMGRGGGWPLTVFLTPDLRPFFGGTYFPPQDRYGMPGFPRLLAAVREGWQERRAELLSSADEFAGGLRKLMEVGLDARPAEPRAQDVALAGERLAAELDPVHGGFAGAPKFPSVPALEALLRGWRRGKDEALRDGVLLALDRMADRGLYDQLGGGFHRYSVDEAWQVPHFEKMLYDNAQLVRLYADAHLIDARRRYAQVVAGTVAWLEREMTSPEGGFYASQDADSPGGEGSFFVWSPEEIEAAAGADLAPLLCRRFGVDERGNFEGGRTVLSLAASAETIARETGRDPSHVQWELQRGERLLFEARERRPRPGRDEKILAGWNGLMIGGLARAARVFERPEWIRLAARAADFVLGAMWRGGRLGRAWAGGGVRIDGMLEDYGDLAEGLVQLYMASFEPRFLEAAAAISRRAVELFWDERAQAFLAAPRDGERLPVPVWAVHDNAWPSWASTLCESLVHLAALTGDEERLEVAHRYLAKMREPMLFHPSAFGRLWCAADALLDGAPALVVVGEPEPAAALLRTANGRYAPTLALAWSPPDREVPPLLRPAFEGKSAPAGRAAAYLCRSFTCERPAESVDDLGARFEAFSPGH